MHEVVAPSKRQPARLDRRSQASDHDTTTPHTQIHDEDESESSCCMEEDMIENTLPPPSEAWHWHKFIHFNGTPYYYQPDYRIITPDDVSIRETRNIVWSHYLGFRSRVRERGLDLPDDAIVELLEEHPDHSAVASYAQGGQLGWSMFFPCTPFTP